MFYGNNTKSCRYIFEVKFVLYDPKNIIVQFDYKPTYMYVSPIDPNKFCTFPLRPVTPIPLHILLVKFIFYDLEKLYDCVPLPWNMNVLVSRYIMIVLIHALLQGLFGTLWSVRMCVGGENYKNNFFFLKKFNVKHVGLL